MDEEIAKPLAIRLALFCVRQTCIEHIHAGKPVDTQTGDYSDVKVVTPSREIPWNELQRISETEMREFIKEVVDKLYTSLLRLDDISFIERMDAYDNPGHDQVGRTETRQPCRLIYRQMAKMMQTHRKQNYSRVEARRIVTIS